MIKNKPIIGIFPTSNYNQTNDAFQDTYRFGNNYIKKIIENGGIPYLIPLCNDEIIPETLELCDGLILPGGSRIIPASFVVIDHFIANNKPILGICLGMQTLASYSVRLSDSPKIINKTKNNHWPVELNRDNLTTLAHNVTIKKDTILYNIFKKETMRVNSVHHYTVSEVGPDFKVSITSEDGLIEGIEYTKDSNFVVGVQFHPEILPELNNIFKVFISKCTK